MVDERRRQALFSRGGMDLSDEQLMVYEDYLHISLRRRSNPRPLMHLQLQMLQDLVNAEKVLSSVKEQKKELQIKTTENIDERKYIDDQIKEAERQIRIHEAIRRCIRDLGDGIAWRLFDYDRAVLAELADRPSGKSVNIEGLESELVEFISVFYSNDGIALLTDLTHFIKLGDIVIKKDDATYEIVEVKKGHKSSGRITRQRQEMRSTVEFLNEGEREINGARFVISEADITPETAHSNIRTLLAGAEKQGAAVEKIGDYLIVFCVDVHKTVEVGSDKSKAIVNKASDAANDLADKGDFVLPFPADDRYIVVRNSAPWSIFPFTESDRIKLITGGLYLKAYVNISAVLRYFELRGWKIKETPDKCLGEFEEQDSPKEPNIAKIQKGPVTVHLPYHLVARIGYEFLKPRTLVEMCEAIFRMPERGTRRFINLIGEPKIWD